MTVELICASVGPGASVLTLKLQSAKFLKVHLEMEWVDLLTVAVA